MTPLLTILVSFVITFILTPWTSRHLLQIGISGADMHKKNKPKLAEMGGLSVAAGFTSAMLAAIAISGDEYLVYMLAALSTILIVTIVGIADDLFQLRQDVKTILPVIAALPLVAINAGKHVMSLPVIGPVEFGIYYSLVIVPLGITGASNALNMLGGLNGLEAGLGIVMHSTILICSMIVYRFNPSAIYAMMISSSMLGALIAFLFYNRYPAKVFPGDVTTLAIGCSLATAVILGNMEKLGLILIAPYLVELLLKARTKFKGQSFGTLRKDGTIEAPKEICSLTHVVMRAGRFTEPQIVSILVGMETFFAMLTFLSVYLTYFH